MAKATLQVDHAHPVVVLLRVAFLQVPPPPDDTGHHQLGMVDRRTSLDTVIGDAHRVGLDGHALGRVREVTRSHRLLVRRPVVVVVDLALLRRSPPNRSVPNAFPSPNQNM